MSFKNNFHQIEFPNLLRLLIWLPQLDSGLIIKSHHCLFELVRHGYLGWSLTCGYT